MSKSKSHFKRALPILAEGQYIPAKDKRAANSHGLCIDLCGQFIGKFAEFMAVDCHFAALIV